MYGAFHKKRQPRITLITRIRKKDLKGIKTGGFSVGQNVSDRTVRIVGPAKGNRRLKIVIAQEVGRYYGISCGAAAVKAGDDVRDFWRFIH
jgi:hypothetical protein